MGFISNSKEEETIATINFLKDIARLLRINNAIVKETNALLIENTNVLKRNEKILDEIKQELHKVVGNTNTL